MRILTLVSLHVGILIGSYAGQTRAQIADAARVFDTGNAEFARGAYAEALADYHQALESGYTSGALYHNMGSAYFRLDELGQAVRYYEKARRLLGDDPQLMHNVAIVQTRVSSPFSQLPPPFWRTWWMRVFVSQGSHAFLWAGAVLYLLAAILYGHRIWTQIRNAWHRRARAAALIVGSLLLLASIGVSAESARSPRAAIIAPGVMLSELPGGAGSLAIPQGVVVDLLESVNGSVEVRLPNGVRGYVDGAALGGI